jgi:hypothetical protein
MSADTSLTLDQKMEFCIFMHRIGCRFKLHTNPPYGSVRPAIYFSSPLPKEGEQRGKCYVPDHINFANAKRNDDWAYLFNLLKPWKVYDAFRKTLTQQDVTDNHIKERNRRMREDYIVKLRCKRDVTQRRLPMKNLTLLKKRKMGKFMPTPKRILVSPITNRLKYWDLVKAGKDTEKRNNPIRPTKESDKKDTVAQDLLSTPGPETNSSGRTRYLKLVEDEKIQTNQSDPTRPPKMFDLDIKGTPEKRPFPAGHRYKVCEASNWSIEAMSKQQAAIDRNKNLPANCKPINHGIDMPVAQEGETLMIGANGRASFYTSSKDEGKIDGKLEPGKRWIEIPNDDGIQVLFVGGTTERFGNNLSSVSYIDSAETIGRLCASFYGDGATSKSQKESEFVPPVQGEVKNVATTPNKVIDVSSPTRDHSQKPLSMQAVTNSTPPCLITPTQLAPEKVDDLSQRMSRMNVSVPPRNIFPQTSPVLGESRERIFKNIQQALLDENRRLRRRDEQLAFLKGDMPSYYEEGETKFAVRHLAFNQLLRVRLITEHQNEAADEIHGMIEHVRSTILAGNESLIDYDRVAREHPFFAINWKPSKGKML